MPEEPENTGSNRPSDSDQFGDEFDEAIEDIVLEHRNRGGGDPEVEGVELIEQVSQGAVLQFKKALDVKTRIVSDTAQAAILSQRHNDMLITEKYIQLVLLYTETGDQKYALAIDSMKRAALEEGFFLFSYSVDKMRERIAHSHANGGAPDGSCYVIGEAFGRHPHKQTGDLHEKGMWSADCQLHLPAAKPGADSVVTFPCEEDGDSILVDALVQEMIEHPERVMIVDDIACSRNMSHLHLASSAMDAPFDEVTKSINPERGEHAIEYVVAEIASVRGVRLPKGKTIASYTDNVALETIEFQGEQVIFNGRSYALFDIFKSRHCTHFTHAYKRNEEHPIVMPGDDPTNPHHLIVTWNGMAAKLKSQNSVQQPDS